MNLLSFLLGLAVAGGGMAWMQVRHRREKRRLSRFLHLVNELSAEIINIGDLDRLLFLAMEAFVEAGHVNKGCIMLIDEATGELEIHAAIGISDARRKTRLKMGEGIAGTVAKTGKPIRVEDVSRDRSLYKESEHDIADGRRPSASILCLPLKSRERVWGVVSLESKFSGKPFEKYDELALSVLAHSVAIAIHSAQSYEASITDGLTQLAIHRHFHGQLEHELSRARRYHIPLSLAMIDIDHFKTFNDTYGHLNGDRAIMQVAQLIKESMRETDLCARYGGEEFGVILTDTNLFDAKVGIENLRKKIASTPVHIDGKDVRITVSAGIASFKDEASLTKLVLIERADQALYYAKRKSRDCVVLWDEVPALRSDLARG